MISDKLTRRTVLKAVGATVALPWLESTPAFADAPAKKAPQRFACLFISPLGGSARPKPSADVGSTQQV